MVKVATVYIYVNVTVSTLVLSPPLLSTWAAQRFFFNPLESIGLYSYTWLKFSKIKHLSAHQNEVCAYYRVLTVMLMLMLMCDDFDWNILILQN